MTRPKILIVDDDADVTLSFKAGLEENGFFVDFYNDPLVALSNFKPYVYDFVLLDVKMPRMNGFELYREIKKIDKNLKVGFVTGFYVYYESLREIFPEEKKSSTCFIKKPVEIDKLVERIRAEILK